MYLLLGVLLATLVALLVLPAVWHRAVRLTTKRVEAAVPVSLFEVQADKDQQRAFFALNQRRLELQIEEMRATIAAHAATIETQRLRIVELEGQVAGLTQTGETSGALAAERQVLVGELQDQVSDLKSRIAALEEDLAGAHAAHSVLQTAHGTLTETTQGLTSSLAEREASLADHGERAIALGSEIALLTTNLTATTQRLDLTTDLLEKERAAVARLTGELEAARASRAVADEESAARAAEVERLTQARDKLAAELATTRGDLDAGRSVLHAFEQRRASEFAEAEAETRRISSALDMMRADHALMAGALEKARGEGPAGPGIAAEADLAPVKTALADVAARIVALATRLEGEGSPVPGLLAQAGDGGDGTGGPSSLADRIRALLAQTPGAPLHAAAGANGGESHPAAQAIEPMDAATAQAAEGETSADAADALLAEPAGHGGHEVQSKQASS